MLKAGMTRLKIHEDIGEEFIVEGRNYAYRRGRR